MDIGVVAGVVALGVVGIGVAWFRGRSPAERVGGSIVAVGLTALVLVFVT